MAEVAHVFICDRAYQDDRGQPCVIGMFDHIWAPDFPFRHPQMVIAIRMVGHQHEAYDVTVDVLNPTKQVILSVHSEAPASSRQPVRYRPRFRPPCSALGFLDSGLTVFASTLPRPARRGHVAPGRGFDSGTFPASTARCTSA